MQRIACLGWGSLIWNPCCLPVSGHWCNDGPMIEVEFARKSRDGRVTLVLCKTDQPVQSLWCLLNVQDLNEAICRLACREQTEKVNIGRWPQTQEPSRVEFIHGLSTWAQSKKLDGVVWTDLPPNFDGSEVTPSLTQVLANIQEEKDAYDLIKDYKLTIKN